MWKQSFRSTSLVVGLASCAFDSAGVGGEESASVGNDSSTSEATTGATSSATTATTLGTETSIDATTEVDTEPACPPGEIGCACLDGVCDDALSCVEGMCVSSECGDGIVQEGEECEPGVGEGAAAGCSDECTFLRGAQSIALGQDHTCAVTHVGVLRCWGSGDRGKLGLGSELDVGLLPGEPASAADPDVGGAVDRVALGSGFSCALRSDGEVVCWGFRANGRLGDGLDDASDDIADERDESADELGPVPVPGTVVDLAVGGSHACALRASGEVYCWGMGDAGRLGYGNTNDVGVTDDPSMVGPVMMPAGFDVARLTAGAGHTCALSTSGDVICWGDAATGILGNESDQDIGDDETPAKSARIDIGGVAVEIDAGSQHTCALLDDGVVRCWGLGDHGRLGYGAVDDVGDDEPPADFTVLLDAPAVHVSAGRAHTCAALDDGSAVCWGQGAGGRLGQGDTANVGDTQTLAGVSPIVVDDDPTAVVIAVEAGGDHSCALLEDGRVRCWGAAAAGQLGYGNNDVIGDDEPPDVAGDVVFLP